MSFLQWADHLVFSSVRPHFISVHNLVLSCCHCLFFFNFTASNLWKTKMKWIYQKCTAKWNHCRITIYCADVISDASMLLLCLLLTAVMRRKSSSYHLFSIYFTVLVSEFKVKGAYCPQKFQPRRFKILFLNICDWRIHGMLEWVSPTDVEHYNDNVSLKKSKQLGW